MGMETITGFFRRILVALRWRRHAADLAVEMEEHRARLQADLEADGIAPAEAAARSRRAMGNITLAGEDARDGWPSATLQRIWRDAVYGARTLRREPTFAATALLTLTLGIATTTAVFSVVDAELWRPLPFPDPRRLAAVQPQKAGGRFDNLSGADLTDWKAQARLARYAATAATTRRVVRFDNRTESVSIRPVTSDFFEVLGSVPRLGRTFNGG